MENRVLEVDFTEWKKLEITILSKEDLSEAIVANARTGGCGFCGCGCGMYSCGVYWPKL